MKSLRIAIMAPLKLGQIGGAQRHVKALGDILVSLGHDVVFFTEDRIFEPKPLEQFIAKLMPSARGAAFGTRFAEYPYFEGFDMVLSFDLSGIGVKHARHLRVLAGSYVPFRKNALKQVTGFAALKRKMWTQLFKLLEKAASQGKPALACSRGLRRALRIERMPVMDQVIFPPVSMPDDLYSTTAGRHSVGLTGEAFCLLFAGRWEYAKGSDRLEKIIEGLPPSWEVVLAVPNPDDVPAAVRARCAFVGPVAPEAMPKFYRAASVTILPSRFEGSSVCLAESLLSNTSVLTTPTGSGLDMAEFPGLDKCVVSDPDNITEWHEAIHFLEDRTNRAAAIVRGRKFAELRYGTDLITRQWADLLTNLK